MRDDFSSGTKETLGKRVNFLCSNPDCQLLTVGPHSEPHKSVNKGVAAHICAAAPGGKRYDDSQTTEQRKGIENGIWLCQNCAKLVDNDEARFPTQLLHAWKVIAESRVSHSIESNSSLPTQDANASETIEKWLAANVHSAKLSESLPRALQLAKQIQNQSLEKWIRLELYGYNSDGGMTDADEVPEYRGVTGRWLNAQGQILDFSNYPDLSIINHYRFRFGVARLEQLAEREQMQNVVDDQFILILREQMGISAVCFSFSPVEMRGVIGHMRNLLTEKIHDALAVKQGSK